MRRSPRWPRASRPGSSAQPASAPRRGTGTTDAARCSVRTRYMAYVGYGHDGPIAGHDAGLGDDVEDLVGSGRDQQLVGPDPVAGGGGRDQASVIAWRILGQRRLETPGRQQALDHGRRGGRGVEVEPDDRGGVDAIALRHGLVRRLPRIGRGRVRWAERDRRRAHRSGPAKRISTASRWASRPSASARAATVSRIAASPSRSMRWTCTNLPYASTLRPPDARASPPVGRT